jgi:AhpD family alkylhydroperoxidase
MKIIFSDRENQHLEPTAATVHAKPARWCCRHRKATLPQVAPRALTNSRDRGNLLVKYENMILVSEEAAMRMSPLPADQWDDAARHAVAGMLPEERRNPRDAGNVLATLVRHPKLTRAFLRFSSYLLYGSTLPPRIREQVILRVAHRRGCAYEWSHHVALAQEAGLSDAEIAAVQSGDPDDEFDRAVLGAVDELDEKTNLSDAAWARLAERLDERQRMDLIFTIGGYTALAMALNTFGVEVEQEK